MQFRKVQSAYALAERKVRAWRPSLGQVELELPVLAAAAGFANRGLSAAISWRIASFEPASLEVRRVALDGLVSVLVSFMSVHRGSGYAGYRP